jgi:cysteinyl-tRNA synthetase
VHNGLLTVNGEKMSKSVGNFITVEQALAEWPHPDYLKLFFLKTHYRSPIDYSAERMGEAKRNWEEFARFFEHYYQGTSETTSGGSTAEEATEAQRAFTAALDEDMNTPKALAALFDLVNAGHRMLESGQPGTRAAARSVNEVLLSCGRVFGLFEQGLSAVDVSTRQRVEGMIAERDQARKAKNFKRADEIRESLQQEGVLLADTAGGTLWRRAR